MFGRKIDKGSPLPDEFLAWQVELRAHTALARGGKPHVGVTPLVTVRNPGVGPGFTSHSIICGILPRRDQLEKKTGEFRALYEDHVGEGARTVYDHGIAYLKEYYRSTADFDPIGITTLLPRDLPLVRALRAYPSCALVFHLFDLDDRSDVGRPRTWQLDCEADLLEEGPVYDNVWWHNTLFHGPTDDHVVVRFRHQGSHDTRFGALQGMGG
jgi:hypothetical protein